MSELRHLSSGESERVLATVAELAAAHMPLADGLRAAASEATGRLAAGLRTLADELQQGKTLDQVCTDKNLRLPPHVRGMVSAAARTGQLGPALDDLLEHQRVVQSVFWQIWSSLAYPLVVFVLNVALVTFMLSYIVPVFKQVLLDFELRLPHATQAIISLSDAAVFLVAGPGRAATVTLIIVFSMFLFFAATGRGGATVQRMIIESVPILGPLWQWSGAAGFMYLLGSLLEKNIPLADALKLTADATRKADLRKTGHWLAEQVASGRNLSDAVQVSGCWPASAVPLLRWGERTNALPEALRSVSDMLIDRVEMRSDWLRSVSPPFLYVFVGLTAAAVIVSMFAPLVSLIQGLS